jgi:hypothetical protein
LLRQEHPHIGLLTHQTNSFEFYIVSLFIAEGDWCFQAFIRKAWGKYPENPVNPVRKNKNKIESIP